MGPNALKTIEAIIFFLAENEDYPTELLLKKRIGATNPAYGPSEYIEVARRQRLVHAQAGSLVPTSKGWAKFFREHEAMNDPWGDRTTEIINALKKVGVEDMTLNEYEKAAMRTAAIPCDDPSELSDALDNAVLGLAGEAGEIADILKKHRHQGHELSFEELQTEFGDALWYIAHAAGALGCSLEDIARGNIDKLEDRYPEGFSEKRSRSRPKTAGAFDEEFRSNG